jgi:hypothetical protein
MLDFKGIFPKIQKAFDQTKGISIAGQHLHLKISLLKFIDAISDFGSRHPCSSL